MRTTPWSKGEKSDEECSGQRPSWQMGYSTCSRTTPKGPQLTQVAFREMQVAKMICHHTRTVLAQPWQPVAHGIFVHFQPTRCGSDCQSFGQQLGSHSIHRLIHPNAGICGARARKNQMPTSATLKTRGVIVHPTRAKLSPPPALTVQHARPIPTTARARIHPRGSLMQSASR